MTPVRLRLVDGRIAMIERLDRTAATRCRRHVAVFPKAMSSKSCPRFPFLLPLTSRAVVRQSSWVQKDLTSQEPFWGLQKGLGIRARIKATLEISFALLMTLWAVVSVTLTSASEIFMNQRNTLVACVFVGAASLRSPEENLQREREKGRGDDRARPES